MFQTFNSDSLGSRFIKSFLAQTPIPNFNSVCDKDLICEGFYYVYKQFIIKCITSGVLYVSESEKQTLYPSDKLYPSVYLFPNSGLKAAQFIVVCYANDFNIKTHSNYESTTNYYDSATHYYLGKYLRYLYTTSEINLFPYYNTFNDTYFSDVRLTKDKYSKLQPTLNSTNKVVGVPVLFNHTYTIAIDCPSEVLMRLVLHDEYGLRDESTLPKEMLNALQSSLKIHPRLQFHNPITFRLEVSDPQTLQLENNLFLAIQLPKNNTSSIVVLENYKSDKVLQPSLLKMNSFKTFAFSDRLIEYLLGNVIHKDEHISENIEKIQRALFTEFPEYRDEIYSKKKKLGVYDTSITDMIKDIVQKYSLENDVSDQDGFVNKDVEKMLRLGELY